MKTMERRLALLEYLCEIRHDTINNLAFEFQVHKNTITNDINELSLSYPIYVINGGANCGVYLQEDFNLTKVYLTPEQVAVLKKYMPSDFNDKKLFEAIINKFQKRR